VNKQRGFTLIELMIASLIGLIVMGGLMNLFITTNRSVALSDALSQNQETGRFAMDYLTKFIRQAGYTEDFTVQGSPIIFAPFGRPGSPDEVTCTSTTEASACSTNNPNDAFGDRLGIPFDVSPGQQVRSCTGTVIQGSLVDQYYVNVFWVSNTTANMRELRCRVYDKGNNNWLRSESGAILDAVTIINNVESFEFQVGLSATTDLKYVNRYVSVDTMRADNQLTHVRSIRIALLTTSVDATNSNKIQTTKKERVYSLLDAPYITRNDGNLRNIFTNTIELTNAIERAGND